MADLDDFFAKKDRKKSKGKKFTTTDEIAKKLEETGKKQLEKAKKDKTTLQSQPSGTETDEQGNAIHQEEDEWLEFEEQKKDYSGLRIGRLQLQEGGGDGEEGADEGEEQVMQENEAGEMVMVRQRKVPQGPWKLQQQQQQQQQQGAAAPQQAAALPPPEETVAPPADVPAEPAGENADPERREEPSVRTYMPPAMRSGQRPSVGIGPTVGGPRRQGKVAPDISNEDSFPTLSAAKEPGAGPWGRRRREEAVFEEVRRSHAGRFSDASRLAAGSSGPKLSLGNKFGALSQEHS